MTDNYNHYTLPNGLRMVHKPSNGPVAHCGFFINVGTRDEKDHEFGMAHFVEHMLFKGTQKRKSYHIINRMEAVGGELNAFTNKEETVIYSTFLPEHYERAVELISDLVTNSRFPQQEIEKEVDVVIDEIQSYNDSPAELIYDDFEDLIFKGMSMGHNILGTEDSLLKFDHEMVRNFVNEHYQLSNIVFFSYGQISFEKLKKIVVKYLFEFPYIVNASKRSPVSILGPQKKKIQKDTAQGHVIVGGYAYAMEDKRRKVLSLINNVLGGPGMNSRLNMTLREKKGYVYNVESNVNSYSDIGIFYIYFGCDKKNIEKCLDYVYKELKKLKENGLSTSQLYSAKKQYIGQMGISSDNSENLSLALGKYFYHFNYFDSLAEVAQKVESITSNLILEVSNEIFDEKNLSNLIYY